MVIYMMLLFGFFFITQSQFWTLMFAFAMLLGNTEAIIKNNRNRMYY